ncbi:hypothetical protein PLIIFM63780_009794 [Purpureocillium lilacinum]|nr:hypothetical protein PLIIFM63780_009794 [Purpureocillium lilacinum]
MTTPTTSPIGTLSAITLVSEDPAASLAFYQRVLGATLLFQDADSAAVRVPGVAPLLNLLRPSAAEELLVPSAVGTAGSGRRAQMTLATTDLEASMAALRARGLAAFLTGPETKPWGVRTVTFEDPAGHSWEVAQEVVKTTDSHQAEDAE